MHLSARFHWKWPPVLWYDLSFRKLIKEVYHDLKYNHFLNRALSYFSPLMTCVDDLTENITMLGVTIKHNSSLHLVIPMLPSSTSHALEFKSCPLDYLSVSTYCMQTWREFDLICVEKTIASFFVGVYSGRENVGFCKA